LKESVKEDNNFCKELVDHYTYMRILVGLCEKRQYEHDLIMERYEQCLKISVEEELTNVYFLVKILCARIREKYDQP
jgi:hypothetical protein